MSEKEWMRQVIQLARLLGWTVAHFRTSRNGSGGYLTAVAADGAGYPDLTLVRDRIIFAELKTNKGKLSDNQIKWMESLRKAGAEYYLWRPSDFEAVRKTLGGMNRQPIS